MVEKQKLDLSDIPTRSRRHTRERAPNPPEFAQPRLSRANGCHPQRERTKFREETKGRFRKRVVLANVPSFRFLVPENIRMYPRSGFWHRETSAKTALFGNHPLSNPRRLGVFVPIWLVLPKCEATNLGVFDLYHFDLLKRGCANSGVLGAPNVNG